VNVGGVLGITLILNVNIVPEVIPSVTRIETLYVPKSEIVGLIV